MIVFKRLVMNRDFTRIAKLQAEIEKEKKDREAWRKAFVPPYFESEWGKTFLENTNRAGLNKESSGNFMQTSEHDFSGATQQEVNESGVNSINKNG
jgi:hypothetical protein